MHARSYSRPGSGCPTASAGGRSRRGHTCRRVGAGRGRSVPSAPRTPCPWQRSTMGHYHQATIKPRHGIRMSIASTRPETPRKQRASFSLGHALARWRPNEDHQAKAHRMAWLVGGWVVTEVCCCCCCGGGGGGGSGCGWENGRERKRAENRCGKGPKRPKAQAREYLTWNSRTPSNHVSNWPCGISVNVRPSRSWYVSMVTATTWSSGKYSLIFSVLTP